jgi:hypothetical protein
VDTNGDASFDEDDNDVLIKIGYTATATMAILSDANGNTDLQFKADGSANEAGTTSYAICDDRGGEYGSVIEISTTGRPQLSKGTSGSPVDCSPAS